ncbi:unnamed protein product [Amoebophrya sp. A120]|nr:unnamed protein product [Amoebophrya sp. A120]|eukprot:GSA120T00022150001.1
MSGCPVCLEDYDTADNRPFVWPSCGHGVCRHCLSHIEHREGTRNPKCPTCRVAGCRPCFNRQLADFLEERAAAKEESGQNVGTTSSSLSPQNSTALLSSRSSRTEGKKVRRLLHLLFYHLIDAVGNCCLLFGFMIFVGVIFMTGSRTNSSNSTIARFGRRYSAEKTAYLSHCAASGPYFFSSGGVSGRSMSTSTREFFSCGTCFPSTLLPRGISCTTWVAFYPEPVTRREARVSTGTLSGSSETWMPVGSL